jgi:hypothetical protein
VPEISRFLGITIRMYYRDHAPPHFHARYGAYSVVVEIESGVVQGRFPPRALRLILEWLELRKDELRRDWERARAGQPLEPIDALE